MNKYLILGPNFPSVNNKYRGIDRIDIPEIPSNLEKAEELNNTIEKYINSRNLNERDGEYINDYKLAKEISSVFTLNNEKNETYEVIQVSEEELEQSECKIFLGYDVIFTNEHGSFIVEMIRKEKAPLFEELKEYEKMLNENSLFNNKKLAIELCDYATRKINCELFYKAVGIYLIK